MKCSVNALIIFLLVLISGCSSNDKDVVSIADSPLKGKVFGIDFIAKGGKAFKSGDKISVKITNIDANCDSDVFDYEYQVSTRIKEVGTVTDANVVFDKKGETPLNQLGSTVIVESITDTSIVLKIKAGKDDNSVEGKFTVPYCK